MASKPTSVLLHPALAALTKIYWLAPVDSQISQIAKEALLRGL